MNTLERQTSILTPGEKLSRIVVPSIFTPLLYEVHPVGLNGLSRARSLLDQGYGLVVGYTHFSERDVIDVMRFIMNWPGLGERVIVSPIAHHMQEKYGHVLGPLSRGASVDLYPIVIQDTVDKEEYKDLQLGTGLPVYLNAAAHILSLGGIVPISLQEGRREVLGDPKPALGRLMIKAKRAHIEKYAVMFVGFELKGVEEFGSMKGWNIIDRTHPGKLGVHVMRINIGSTYTADEVFDIAGGLRGIDPFAFGEFAGLVPESYKTPKTAPVGA